MTADSFFTIMQRQMVGFTAADPRDGAVRAGAARRMRPRVALVRTAKWLRVLVRSADGWASRGGMPGSTGRRHDVPLSVPPKSGLLKSGGV